MRSVTEQMEEIFRNYPDKVNEIVDDVSLKVAKDTADRLKNTSPRRKGRGGKYARGWSVRRDPDSAHGHVVYNREPQFTHLLEYGHVVRNKFGTYGRARAIRHIEPAEEAGQMQYELQLRVRIKGML